MDANDMIQLAKEIATEAHSGQVRKFGPDQGKPYIVHPERVARRISDAYMNFRDSTNVGRVCIAWLHDVIEDTDVNGKELLERGMPVEVVYGVQCLSKREEENYYTFIMRIKDTPLVIPVKIADIEDNMSTLKDGSLKDKYRFALHVLKHR